VAGWATNLNHLHIVVSYHFFITSQNPLALEFVQTYRLLTKK
jgi:hypothetical protein